MVKTCFKSGRVTYMGFFFWESELGSNMYVEYYIYHYAFPTDSSVGDERNI